MISAKIKNFIIRYDFESKIRTNYIHKIIHNILDEYVKSNNLMILSIHYFEVYKGFVNLMEMKYRSFSKNDYKYGIYLY